MRRREATMVNVDFGAARTGRSRVPRPFERWLAALFGGEAWNDVGCDHEWLKKLRAISAERGCSIVFDPGRHWAESVYFESYRDRGPAILAGGAGNPKHGCTAILHELGHHILCKSKRSFTETLQAEEAAWKEATRLAQQERLPFVAKIRRQGLYSYRLAKLRAEQAGSQRRNYGGGLPPSWRLERSKRSSQSSLRSFEAMGKKGRRQAKKHIKRSTSRAERRRQLPDD